VALAVLMPIVASMGGNAATQSLAVAVRALATRDLTSVERLAGDPARTWCRASNGLSLALPLGLAVGTVIFGDRAWGRDRVALIINLFVAALAGPCARRSQPLGFDPAVASGTFVTTVTDVVGFFAFLGLASTICCESSPRRSEAPRPPPPCAMPPARPTARPRLPPT
jgi:magnesium transporter